MPIELNCTGCGATLRVADHHAGKQARCPSCGIVFPIGQSADMAGMPSTDTLWHVKTEDSTTFGPVRRSELESWVSEGRITTQSELRRDDQLEWQSAVLVFPGLGSPTSAYARNPFADADAPAAYGGYQPTLSGYGGTSGFPSQGYLRPHRGGVILTLGILAIMINCFLLFIPGICAWTMGSSDLAAMRRGRMDPSGMGLTQAGMILGIIGTILSGFGVLAFCCSGLAEMQRRAGFEHGWQNMSILGAHMSIVGGYWKAAQRARECDCDCVQVFTKNNSQWRAKPIGDDEAERFQAALAEFRVSHPLSHSSYLINLASPDPALWKKSIDAFVVELRRAEQLGIPYVVLHPGSYTTSSEARGLKKVTAALDEVQRQTRDVQARCLLENTAGQGSNLGWRFEHLAAILDGVKDPDRLGICLDTCHTVAAGYPLAPEPQYKATMRELNKTVGVARIKAIHLNDSKGALGSRIDRHQHIGRGHVGLQAFRLLVNDRRFRKTPMYLETAKGQENGVEWDVANLRTLRKLIEPAAQRRRKVKKSKS